MNSYGTSYTEEEQVSEYRGTAGTVRVITSLMSLKNDAGITVQQLVTGTRLEFEGMDAARERAIVKFMAVKNFTWVGELMQGREMNCPFLLDALAQLETAVVFEEEEPQKPEVDILSLTKDFINDHSK